MSIPQVRVQVAFESTPDAATDLWTDVTAWTDLAAGVRHGRGRQDERAQTTGHVCSLTLDNKDGRFTAGSPSSPYYPNVQIGRKVRVSARVGSARGNLLAAEDASFEGGTTGSWLNTYIGAPAAVTLANSATHPSHGTKGLLITWPAAARLCAASVYVPTVKGRTYTARCVVWIPAGHPSVAFGDLFGFTPYATSTTTGAPETLMITWTATSSDLYLGVLSNVASTAGQQCWVDAIQVDEGDANLGTFTTSPPPIFDRFTGYALGWPTGFPGGNVSDVLLTAGDRIAYKDALRDMRSAPSEAILAELPEVYYPLTEDSSATSAEDVSGMGQPTLTLATYGAGTGTVEFGQGTGPATDSAPAVMFTPTSVSNGRYLSAPLTTGIGFFGATLVACINTSTAAKQTVARLADGGGWQLHLGTDATGKLTAHVSEPWGGTHWSLTSPASVANGATRVVGVTVLISGGTVTVKLWVDGVQVATTSIAGTWMSVGYYLHVGGNPASGDLFTGTLSHVAAWADGDVDMATVSDAILLGLAEQTVNDSLAQVALWAGVSASEMVAETGLLTRTSHRPTEGQRPASVLLALANDEGGVLYVDGSGHYRMHARDHRWNVAPILTIDSRHLASSDLAIDYDTQGLANDASVSRPTGGGGARVVNQDSVDELGGRIAYSTTVAAAQDGDLVARAGWEANSRATTYPRISSLPVDLLTMDDALTLAAAALDVGDTLTLATLPSQSAGRAFDLTIEGWSEVMSLTSWRIDLNTSRSQGLPSSAEAIGGQPLFVLDHPVLGRLDAGIITGY